MTDLPARARVVVVGGGVGGASIAYHLAQRGETDVVVVERAELTSGSTFHSAGLVGQLRGSVTLTRMMMDSTTTDPVSQKNSAALLTSSSHRSPPRPRCNQSRNGSSE